MNEDEANRRADVLVEQLGPGWQKHVHENLGWHYSAFNGPCKVTPSYSGEQEYSCSISDKFVPGECPIGSPMAWHDHGYRRFKDPRLAVTHAISLVRSVVQQYRSILAAAEATVTRTTLKTESEDGEMKGGIKPSAKSTLAFIETSKRKESRRFMNGLNGPEFSKREAQQWVDEKIRFYEDMKDGREI